MRRREPTAFERAWLGSAPVTRLAGDRELDPLGELDVVVRYEVAVKLVVLDHEPEPAPQPELPRAQVVKSGLVVSVWDEGAGAWIQVS